jgi:hypothetical protein
MATEAITRYHHKINTENQIVGTQTITSCLMPRRPHVKILVQKTGILRMFVVFTYSLTNTVGQHLKLGQNRFLPHLFPTQYSRIVLTLLQRFPYFLRRGALFRKEIRRGALSSHLNQRHVCAYLAAFS